MNMAHNENRVGDLLSLLDGIVDVGETYVRYGVRGCMLIASALVPPVLVALGRRWRWVLLSLVVGAMASITWYVLWYVIAIAACSV